MKGKFNEIDWIAIDAKMLEKYILYRDPSETVRFLAGILTGIDLIDIEKPVLDGELKTDVENAIPITLRSAETWHKRHIGMKGNSNASKDKGEKAIPKSQKAETRTTQQDNKSLIGDLDIQYRNGYKPEC